MISIQGKKIKIKSIQKPLLAILENRKIANWEDKDFFEINWDKLIDPFLFRDMEKVVERIIKSIEKKERIIIFWDYDVDWVSSTALLVKFLTELKAQVSYRLPHRVNDWYWLKKYFIDDIAEKWTKLLITVDCWTKDIEAIDYASSKWIDVIITDHHIVPQKISENIVWIINPKNLDDTYPNRDLSWSWVVYKLIHALTIKLFEWKKTEEILKKYIDFAMLGTIADCMLLTWENRVISTLWLRHLKYSNSKWLKKLLEWYDYSSIDADIIWFKVWPRINAAGRMDSPYKALKALLAWEENIDEILSEIEDLNTKRKTSSQKFFETAKKNINLRNEIIFFNSEEIEHWILGLIAGRLSEQFNKVAIITRQDGDNITWSIRSPEFINIIELMEECSYLFDFFGWHHQAAWFSMKSNNYNKLKKCLEQLVYNKTKLVDTQKRLEVECEAKLEDINFELIEKIEKLKPFWNGNPKPLFLIKINSDIILDYLGKDRKHLKFSIPWIYMEFKAFGLWEYFGQIRQVKEFYIITEIEKNIWNWKKKISFNIKDFVV